jgi:DNA-binding MarR family transcriptional regulator/N-acetylglutamate synthase-like GNAT family acetyltransferase
MGSMQQIDAVRRFNRFYTRRIGVLKEGMVGSPYTLPEARVLYELGQAPQATATVLGRALAMDLGYMSRLVQSLKRRGLIQARRAPHDGRHNFLSLTEKGRKVYTLLNSRSRDEMGAMLAPLESSERGRLVAAMRTVESLLGGEKAAGEIVLRPHRPGDMGWVVERHAALYFEQDGWGAGFEALIAEIVRTFLVDFDPARERCWIAERDGARIGCVFVVKQSKHTAKLRLLLVEPRARGTGLGGRLVEECIAFAREKGYRKMVLWTHAHLAAARAIYRKTGFKRVRTEAHSTFGPRVVGEYWELKL